MNVGKWAWAIGIAAGVAVGVAAASPAQAASKDPGKYRIYLSMSYIGNDWQAEAANMLKALAASKEMRDKVALKIQVAGPNATRQIQQINAMVEAGAQAIIVYPISPTALNEVVRHACARGVIIAAYDSIITEPCAYNTHLDQSAWGRIEADWLVKALKGKGNIVMITGVSGTTVDTLRTKAAQAVFAKYPGIHVIASADGMWSQAVARTVLSKIVTTHPWSTIDGLWMEAGCYTANAMQKEAGIADDKLKPCAGEGTNGHRIQMLPEGTKVDGAHGDYRPMGAPSISVSSPVYSGAMALQMVFDKLEGKPVKKLVLLPPDPVTSETLKICKTGSWQEMREDGCNTFPPALVPNPGWFDSIYSPLLPELGMKAALSGQPED